MDLFDKISDDIKKAMLARDAVRLESLRGIKKEFLEATLSRTVRNWPRPSLLRQP